MPGRSVTAATPGRAPRGARLPAAPPTLAALAAAVRSAAGQTDLRTALGELLTAAVELTGARSAAIAVVDLDGTGMRDIVTVGDEETAALTAAVTGTVVAGGGPPADPQPHHGATLLPLGAVLEVAITAGGEEVGRIRLGENARGGAFTATDEAAVTLLAAQAAAAIGTARGLAVAEEGWRRAMELYDAVVQRLYGVGMALEAAVLRTAGADQRVAAAVSGAVDEIDAAIREIGVGVQGLGRLTVERWTTDRVTASAPAAAPGAAPCTPPPPPGEPAPAS